MSVQQKFIYLSRKKEAYVNRDKRSAKTQKENDPSCNSIIILFKLPYSSRRKCQAKSCEKEAFFQTPTFLGLMNSFLFQ